MVGVGCQRTREAMQIFLDKGISRVPIVDDDADDVVGVLYLKDVARWMAERPGEVDTAAVSVAMRPVVFVPDSKPADDLLRQMQAARVHLAVVVDEYGGTAGLVTIEDVLEEIVGEIADEYDQATQPEIVQIEAGRWRLDPKVDIDDLAALTGIDLDAERASVDTVAGLLARHLGAVLVPGSQVVVRGLRLTAESGSQPEPGHPTRVDSVLIERVTTRPETAGGMVSGEDRNGN